MGGGRWDENRPDGGSSGRIFDPMWRSDEENRRVRLERGTDPPSIGAGLLFAPLAGGFDPAGGPGFAQQPPVSTPPSSNSHAGVGGAQAATFGPSDGG